MSTSRIESLKKILEIDPKDSFSRYALGLEYASAGESEMAKTEFMLVLDSDENYLAVYYQLGKVLESLGDNENAKEIYEKGIFVATAQNDMHTRSELEQSLDEL